MLDSPLHPSTPHSTARRSLAAIQYEVAGGKLQSARRCSERRFVSHQKKSIIAEYNPQTPGDCLFA
eukprot:1587374-Amphidinium_carterae.1